MYLRIQMFGRVRFLTVRKRIKISFELGQEGELEWADGAAEKVRRCTFWKLRMDREETASCEVRVQLVRMVVPFYFSCFPLYFTGSQGWASFSSTNRTIEHGLEMQCLRERPAKRATNLCSVLFDFASLRSLHFATERNKNLLRTQGLELANVGKRRDSWYKPIQPNGRWRCFSPTAPLLLPPPLLLTLTLSSSFFRSQSLSLFSFLFLLNMLKHTFLVELYEKAKRSSIYC